MAETVNYLGEWGLALYFRHPLAGFSRSDSRWQSFRPAGQTVRSISGSSIQNGCEVSNCFDGHRALDVDEQGMGGRARGTNFQDAGFISGFHSELARGNLHSEAWLCGDENWMDQRPQRVLSRVRTAGAHGGNGRARLPARGSRSRYVS